MNQQQKNLLTTAANALPDAWREQWSMIEDDEEILAAEYLATTAVARALSDLSPGRVRIERLIRRTFCNGPMRWDHIQTPVPACFRQGRIDVTVFSDETHFLPKCLVEVKRNMNLGLIEADADRMARLITFTKPSLSDLFGFCLFPVVFAPLPTDPPDYVFPKAIELKKVQQMVNRLRAAHPFLLIDLHPDFPGAEIERPSVVEVEYEEGVTEKIWDSDGFRMEPVAITVERLTGVQP